MTLTVQCIIIVFLVMLLAKSPTAFRHSIHDGLPVGTNEIPLPMDTNPRKLDLISVYTKNDEGLKAAAAEISKGGVHEAMESSSFAQQPVGTNEIPFYTNPRKLDLISVYTKNDEGMKAAAAEIFREGVHEAMESSSLAQKITTHNSIKVDAQSMTAKEITFQDVLRVLNNQEYMRTGATTGVQEWTDASGPGIKATLQWCNPSCRPCRGEVDESSDRWNRGWLEGDGEGVYSLSIALTSKEDVPILQGYFSRNGQGDSKPPGQQLIVNPTTFNIAMLRTPAFFQNTELHPKRLGSQTSIGMLAEPSIFGFFKSDGSFEALKIGMSHDQHSRLSSMATWLSFGSAK